METSFWGLINPHATFGTSLLPKPGLHCQNCGAELGGDEQSQSKSSLANPLSAVLSPTQAAVQPLLLV